MRKHKMFDVVCAGGESIGDSAQEPFREIDEQYPEGGSLPAGRQVLGARKENNHES